MGCSGGGWPFSSSPAGFSPVSDFSPLLGPCASCPPPDTPGWLPEGWMRNCPCVSHMGWGGRGRKEGTISGASPCGCLRARLPPNRARRPFSSGQGGHAARLLTPALLCTPGPPGAACTCQPPKPVSAGGASRGAWHGGGRCAAMGRATAPLPPGFPHAVWSLLSPGRDAERTLLCARLQDGE